MASAQVALRPKNEAPRPAAAERGTTICQLGGRRSSDSIITPRLQLRLVENGAAHCPPILAKHYFRASELMEASTNG